MRHAALHGKSSFGLWSEDWRPLQAVAAKYYESLYQFNIEQALQRSRILAPNAETESEATERLLFERATLDEAVAVLHEPAALETECSPIDPLTMRPGAMPPRMAGRAPKCSSDSVTTATGSP